MYTNKTYTKIITIYDIPTHCINNQRLLQHVNIMYRPLVENQKITTRLTYSNYNNLRLQNINLTILTSPFTTTHRNTQSLRTVVRRVRLHHASVSHTSTGIALSRYTHFSLILNKNSYTKLIELLIFKKINVYVF